MARCEFCKKGAAEYKCLSFHRFPPKYYKAWVKNMGRETWTPSKHSVLCSDHFTNNCFDKRDQRTRLRKGSIPTIFNGVSQDDDENENETLLYNDIHPNLSIHSTNCETNLPIEFCAVNEIEVTDLSSQSVIQELPILSTLTSKSSEIAYQREVIKHDHYYEDTTRSLKEKLFIARSKLAQVRREKKVFQQRVKRLCAKVKAMEGIIERLKNSRLPCENGL